MENALGDEYQIECLDYFSPSKRRFYKAAPNHLNIAEGILTDLGRICDDLSKDEIVFIAHSNGGIVVKKILDQINLRELNHNITKICFLDVPHNGSMLAFGGRFINPLNKHLRALRSNSDSLSEINLRWIKQGYESSISILNLIAGIDDIVPRASSQSHYPDSITIPNVNHSKIAKPDNTSSHVFKLVFEFLKAPPKIAKYEMGASRRYRKWRKIDRHHNLAYIEDEERTRAFESLVSVMSSNKPFVRLTGLSGLGKSRLIVEYIDKLGFPEDSVIIYNASVDEVGVFNAIERLIDDEVEAFVVVENCPVSLHDSIAKIIPDSLNCKLITVDFYHDKVPGTPHIMLEPLASEKIETLLRQRLSKVEDRVINRLKTFVEGFPLLADMLVGNYEETNALSSEFTERDLVEKLINADSKLTAKQRELLKVMSLFDVFMCETGINGEVNRDRNLILEVADANLIDFETVITRYSERNLINVVGRFARVTPKPLAINLAIQWWRDSLLDRQSFLVQNIPESMIDSFCKQITFLDKSENVQNFVETFCERTSPFGQAELLLSKQGSRLFRALVEVNPVVTSNLLHRVLNELSNDALLAIEGDVRRNLVWALEMLVFHDVCFDEAAWCLFLLARNENESYSNNSRGQFSQIFRVQLAGTEANFEKRLRFLGKALELNDSQSDSVIVAACKSAISSYGGSRAIGAEHQGTKPALQEWVPRKWDQVYDYWKSIFEFLVTILNRGELAESVKDVIGNELRSLVRHEDFLGTLDIQFKSIIEATNKYWYTASQSIRNVYLYDSEGLTEYQLNVLSSWDELLSPDLGDLKEQLILLVLNPSRDYEEGEDGRHIDAAAEDAKDLAARYQNKIDEVVGKFDVIFEHKEQKQSVVFGRELVLLSPDYKQLITAALDYLEENDNSDARFFYGLASGLARRSQKQWKELLKSLSKNSALVKFYPDVLTLGEFSISDLNDLIVLIKTGMIGESAAFSLTYGSVTAHLSETEIAHFCDALSEINENAKWAALSNAFMYFYGNKDIDFSILVPTLSNLVLSVSFDKSIKPNGIRTFQWYESVKKLVDSEGVQFAQRLCKYLLSQVSSSEVDYSDLWDYLSKSFLHAFQLYGDKVWPVITELDDIGNNIQTYRLGEICGSGKSYKGTDKSVFDYVSHALVIDWCKRRSENLIFVARSISLIVEGENEGIRKVNPLAVSLISNFSHSTDFLNELVANFNSRSWTGSLIPYLESDKAVIKELLNDNRQVVVDWAIDFVKGIDRDIEHEKKREGEESLLRG